MSNYLQYICGMSIYVVVGWFIVELEGVPTQFPLELKLYPLIHVKQYPFMALYVRQESLTFLQVGS